MDSLSKRVCRVLLMAVLALPACSAQPATPAAPLSPSPVAVTPPANYAGVWFGTFSLSECSGERHCFVTVQYPKEVRMRAVQIGTRVTGILLVGHPSSPTPLDIQGEVGPDGRLTLDGVGTDPGYAGPPSITHFEGHVDAAGQLDAAIGVAFGAEPREAGWPVTPVRWAGRFTGARVNATPSAASFAGTWVGAYRTLRCVPGPALHCLGESSAEFDMRVHESGAGVSGQMHVRYNNTFAVSGQRQGDALLLEGESGPGSGQLPLRLTGFRAQRDAAGRLSGVLTVVSPHFTAELELLRVVLVSDEP